LLGTIAIVVLFGQRLLPQRSAKSIPANLSDYARIMVKQYHLPDGLVRLRVERGSPLVGTARSALNLARYSGIAMVGVHAGAGGPVTDTVLQENAVLVLGGSAGAIGRLADTQALGPLAESSAANAVDSLVGGEVGVAELMIPPRSAAIGMPVS